MQSPSLKAGSGEPLLLISGPCAIESEGMVLETAHALADMCAQLKIRLVFKSSYDKANRTSASSGRGLGLEKGLQALSRVRSEVGVPVLTDVHDEHEVAAVAAVADVLQVPAFLCRQTDLVKACGQTGKPVNIKKGQFIAPTDMQHIAQKAAGGGEIWLCERGSCFGYHDLIVDMRSLAVMRGLGYPVVYDATHSVQRPGAEGGSSGGRRMLVAPLARAAVAVGVEALFVEAHPDPDKAVSDRMTQMPLADMRGFLEPLLEIDRTVKARESAGRPGNRGACAQ